MEKNKNNEEEKRKEEDDEKEEDEGKEGNFQKTVRSLSCTWTVRRKNEPCNQKLTSR